MFHIKEFYQDPITITLGVIALTGTAVSVDQQKAAARDQKRSQKAQRRIQDIKSAKERRKQVRAAQAAQAEIAAGGVASGTTKTSGTKQGAGSVQSQLASNLSFLDQVESLNKESSIFSQKAAGHQTRAGTAQAVSGLALTGASLFAPTST